LFFRDGLLWQRISGIGHFTTLYRILRQNCSSLLLAKLPVEFLAAMAIFAMT
jgi:hypothetical protein